MSVTTAGPLALFGLALLLPVGLGLVQVAAGRRADLKATLGRLALALPVAVIGTLLLGGWLLDSLGGWPLALDRESPASPFALTLGPTVGGPAGLPWPVQAAAALSAVTILAGALIGRLRTAAFLQVGAWLAGVGLAVAAAWGWASDGWLVATLGFVDRGGAVALHGVAGMAALGLAVGLRRDPLPAAPNEGEMAWLAPLGLPLVLVGMVALLAATHVTLPGTDHPIDRLGLPAAPWDMAGTLLTGLAGGVLAGHLVGRGTAFWLAGGGIAGMVGVSAGAGLYHPVQALLIALLVVPVVHRLHGFLTTHLGLDDRAAVGAVHGLGGMLSAIVAGYVLWGYPAVDPLAAEALGRPLADLPTVDWLGVGGGPVPLVSPLGNAAGALLLGLGLGLVPGWLIGHLVRRAHLPRPEVAKPAKKSPAKKSEESAP
ncbi:hypothetical protein [Roseospirillum parvum]|uniref:Ammonia channel protein AmtB n=1 Tax=Roseospirillum parvum TaxID=83401 RepID=A0A1G7WE53_9PROT|nr:hypothetical protein [Roseospirillum parvum]SDG70305.1 Ammonia channel protein AmtB [Roseospirillum parvum]